MKSKWWLISLLVCLGVASLSPLASSSPDGLERVAEDSKFITLAQEAPFQVIADYVFPGIESEALATILAGLIGTLSLFGVAYAIAWFLVLRKKEAPIKIKGGSSEA
jgi:cobalt/nickel transport protein